MIANKYEVGSRLEVEEGGVWYPVRVTQVDDSRIFIHYEGWSQRYDKWLDKEAKNIRNRRHTMKRRSRANEEEKPPSKKSAHGTLKVGGVFSFGGRKSVRKSVDSPKEQSEQPEKRPIPSKAKENLAVKPIRINDKPESKPDSEPLATVPEPVSEPTTEPGVPAQPVGVLAVPPKGAPPIGYAYEVVTNVQDLIPKKAFTINEDHNEFKCTQENCNKGFRKEKLLYSHLKHYHNISIDLPEPSPTVTSSPSTPVSTEPKKKRPLRKSRLDNDEQKKIEKDRELAAENVNENSSSTDVSNVTIVESPETPGLNLSDLKNALSPRVQIQRLSSPTSSELQPSVADNEFISPSDSAGTGEVTSPSGTPVAAQRPPLYGRVGQNRFVPIPEPLVLGREKRRVVKTERMQEAEGVFIKRQKSEIGAGGSTPVTPTPVCPVTMAAEASSNKKEKRRKSHGGDIKDDVEDEAAALTRGLSRSEPPSEDEFTIGSPKSSDNIKQQSDASLEKDMVHCQCGVEEESGLMMQCDLCLCWQHGSCFGIENEQLVPERYVCTACQNARRVLQRQSHQVAAFRAMSEGRLPSLAPGSPSHPQRFANLTKVAETMELLKKGLRGIETRILKVYQDTEKSLTERQILLDAAIADSDNVQQQLDICERVLHAIDRPTSDQGSETLILRDTVKNVLKDLTTAQRLTLFK